MGDLLGAEITPPKVVVRVGGYPIVYGSPVDSWVAFCRELPEVFGGGVHSDNRIVRSKHLPHSGLVCPRWDITLTGVPKGWLGVFILPADTRGRNRV